MMETFTVLVLDTATDQFMIYTDQTVEQWDRLVQAAEGSTLKVVAQ